MFKDVPPSAIESPRGRHSVGDVEHERQRLRELLLDRDRRQKILQATDGRSSTRSGAYRPLAPGGHGVDLSRVNVLPREAVNTFGAEAGDRLKRQYGPTGHLSSRLEGEDRLIDDIMRKRTQEFAWKKDMRAAKLRQLNDERQRLLEERERIAAKRQQVAQRPLSPPYGEDGLASLPDNLYEEWRHQRLRPTPPPGPFRASEPEPVRDILQSTKLQLPRQVERYRELRQKFDKDRVARTKPYRGELGVDSYEPWQVRHFHVCRSIVDEEVSRFLDSVFPLVPAALTEKTSQALREDDRRRLEQQWKAVARNKLAQLVAEELMLEVTSEQSRAAAREYHFLNLLAKNMADQMCMREAEIMATSRPYGRDETDPAYAMVTDAFYQSQRGRDKERKRLWLHKQHAHTAVAPTETERQLEAEDDDLHLIEFQHFPAVQMKKFEPLSTDMIWDVRQLERTKQYMQAELDYWKNFTMGSNYINITKGTKGISSISLSPNDQFLAIGTQHGDLLIYDLRISVIANQPVEYRCLRVLLNVHVDDPLINVGWSRDSNQLATVHRLGQVNMWTFTAGSVSKEDASKLAVNPDKVTGVYPTQLMLIHQMDNDAFDFRFSSGPFSAQANFDDQKWMPNFSAFFPSFTVFGSQYTLVIGMSTNDLLLIDTEPMAREFGKAVSKQTEGSANRTKKGRTEEVVKLSKPKMALKNAPDHRVGNEELSSDLFRSHKHPVIHVGFIDSIGDMFSVDEQGYIFIWKYINECLSEYHWFRPFRKYRLNMQVTYFTPSPQAKPLVRFDEKDPELKTADQVTRKRLKVESELDRIGFRHPWREVSDPNNITYIYRPLTERATESGSMFHEVIRSKKRDGELTKYSTRVYKSNIVFADFFLGCAMNASNTELVCMLLVPASEPFPARIEIVTVNLLTMKAREPRIQIDLEPAEYAAVVKQGVLYFDVSRPINATGGAYVFVNLLGLVRIYSLSTGQLVAKPIDMKKGGIRGTAVKSDFAGLPINMQQFKLRSDLELRLASTQERFLAIFYKRGEFQLRVMRFEDKNPDENRLNVSELFMSLKDKIVYPRDFRMGGDNSYFYPDTHPVAGVREALYRAMDKAIQSKLGEFPLEKRKTHDQLNRVNGYAAASLGDRLTKIREPPAYEKPDSDTPLVGDYKRL